MKVYYPGKTMVAKKEIKLPGKGDIGLYHTGIEIDGTEYFYGFGDSEDTGVG